MLRNWWYWFRYHPEYGITHKGNIKVRKINAIYKIILPITLYCENRDDLEILSLNCESLAIKIKPQKIKGRKQSYFLKFQSGERLWSIHPLKKLENADYTLGTWSPIMPRLGDSVLCKPLNLGSVTLKGINRVLKMKAFDAQVDWGDLK